MGTLQSRLHARDNLKTLKILKRIALIYKDILTHETVVKEENKIIYLYVYDTEI